MSPQPELIVGIDLGTTFSLVAHVDERGPHVLTDDAGDARLPSVVAVSAEEGGPARLSLGWEARRHALERPDATVYSVKRLIGKGIRDLAGELPYLAYGVVAGPRETVQVEVGSRRYSPEEISAAILRELRDRAERHLDRPVRKAVITVPAYFDDAQRQATRDAARAAGLEAVRIINEPTAAALAYGLGLRDDRAGGSNGATETIAVYDLGGGTFDASILRIEGGVFQVRSTSGDTHLGGDDFDRLLVDLVRREVREQFGIDVDSPHSRQALRDLAEAAKIRLSDQREASIELDLGGGRVYRRTVSRDEFEWLAEALIARTIDHVRRAMHDARLSTRDLNHIVLVGGSTRMPLVRRRVEEFFGRAPYTALDPDQVVAIGAAVQAAVLAGRPLDMLLLDVIPLSLGVETMGGAMSKLILRNTTVPCRVTEQFTTFVDGQTAIRFNVLQGERELAADCRTLAAFELRGLPPMPAGIPKVEVEFLVDANGILNVAARELRSGAAAAIQVVPNHGLTADEVERIAQESVEHGREDVEAHRRIDLRNQVEFDTHKAEQMLTRVGHLLEPQEREQIERGIESLRLLAREAADLDELHRALEAFGRGTVRLAEIGVREALRT